METETGFRTPKKKYSSEWIPEAFLEREIPTVYDYHIVVVSKEAIRFGRDFLSAKKDDFASLMRAPFPATLVVPIIGGNENYEGWVPNMEKLKQREGDSLKLKDKHWAYSFMKKYQKNFTWRAHADLSIASHNEEQAQRYIATNITDNPIAFESPMGNGRTVFLPFYTFGNDTEESLFLRDLLNSIQNRYKVRKDEVIPSWVSKPDYRLPLEEEIERRAKSIEQEKASLSQIRSILWLDGLELVNSVAHTLRQLDVRCEVKEIEGRHDVEIFEPELHATVEVKGLSGYANYQDIRQLLDWHVEARRQDEKVKGIFLLNDFREAEPELRLSKMREKVRDGKSLFTKDAERIAETNNFCLLTSYQLFRVFKLKSTGSFNKLDFLKTIRDTKGLFQLET